MLNGFGLTQRAWSGRDGLELSELVAAQRRAVGLGSRVLRNPPQNAQPFLGRISPNRLRLGMGRSAFARVFRRGSLIWEGEDDRCACREWVERGADAGRGYKIRRAAKGARQTGACNSSRLSAGE